MVLPLRRSLRLYMCYCVLCTQALTAADPSTPEPPSSAASSNASQGILINFNNVSIVELIRFISRASGKNFIFDEGQLQFNVTMVSEESTSLENVMTALMQVLRVHGLTLLEQDNNILIHQNPNVNQISRLISEQDPAIHEAELITRVFRLNSLDADKAGAIIQPLTSAGALIEVIRDTGHVIVTDLSTNVTKIGQLIKTLDAPIGGLTIGQYVVVNGLLDPLVAFAEKVMKPIAEGRPLVFVSHGPSNSVFIVSTPYLVDQALGVLHSLDINVGKTRLFHPDTLHAPPGSSEITPGSTSPGSSLTPSSRSTSPSESRTPSAPAYTPSTFSGPSLPNANTLNIPTQELSPWSADLPSGHIERTKFYIHKLRYRKGDQIVEALGNVALSLQESGASNVDLIASIQSVQWLEASNSLVFTGTAASILKVKELIEEIDTPLRQVFIEMLILDTSVDDALQYGVNFGARFNNGDTAGAEAFLTGTGALASALDTAAPALSLDPNNLARDLGYNLGIIGRNVTHCGVEFSSLGALVHALHDKQKTEILMNPKLLVEDNATAEIFVGINTPFQTQAIANDRGSIITNNYEFRDIGTTLKVTPMISNNGMVTMEILEEVSSLVDSNVINNTASLALQSQSPGPTTRKSKSTTKVHVPNRYFLVMSGMMQDQFDRRRNQVPCLGGAPLIGALFSDKRLKDAKRNLMIFIRPEIIDSAEEIDSITRHQQDLYRAKTRTKKMWKYEVEEALDLLNIKEPDVSLHDTEQYNP